MNYSSSTVLQHLLNSVTIFQHSMYCNHLIFKLYNFIALVSSKPAAQNGVEIGFSGNQMGLTTKEQQRGFMDLQRTKPRA
ncbi:hypothetical protein ACOSQ2_012303 [Xanthoceras sorbifolium]